MTELFLRVVNLSIAASWLVLAVLLLRLILPRSPRWVPMLLWGLVGIRLICPLSLESVWSLIPSAQTISPTLLTDATPTVHTGFPALNQSINPVLSQAACAFSAASIARRVSSTLPSGIRQFTSSVEGFNTLIHSPEKLSSNFPLINILKFFMVNHAKCL